MRNETVREDGSDITYIYRPKVVTFDKALACNLFKCVQTDKPSQLHAIKCDQMIGQLTHKEADGIYVAGFSQTDVNKIPFKM